MDLALKTIIHSLFERDLVLQIPSEVGVLCKHFVQQSELFTVGYMDT